jgi:hypothetical protein
MRLGFGRLDLRFQFRCFHVIVVSREGGGGEKKFIVYNTPAFGEVNSETHCPKI